MDHVIVKLVPLNQEEFSPFYQNLLTGLGKNNYLAPGVYLESISVVDSDKQIDLIGSVIKNEDLSDKQKLAEIERIMLHEGR